MNRKIPLSISAAATGPPAGSLLDYFPALMALGVLETRSRT
jgi:hypothetical protein